MHQNAVLQVSFKCLPDGSLYIEQRRSYQPDGREFMNDCAIVTATMGEVEKMFVMPVTVELLDNEKYLATIEETALEYAIEYF